MGALSSSEQVRQYQLLHRARSGEEPRDRYECVVIDSEVRVGPMRYLPFVSSKEKKRLEAEAKKLAEQTAPSAAMSSTGSVSASSDAEGDAKMEPAPSAAAASGSEVKEEEEEDEEKEEEEDEEEEKYMWHRIRSGNCLSWSEAEEFRKQAEADARKRLGITDEDTKDGDSDDDDRSPFVFSAKKQTTLQQVALRLGTAPGQSITCRLCWIRL